MRTRIGKKWLFVGLASLALVAAPAVSRAGVKKFMTVIDGAQETPPNPSSAMGNGILTYDTGTKTLCYYLSYIGALSGAETAAHIHGPAAPGTPAGVILALPLGTTKTSCVVDPAPPFDKADLLKSLYYVNIHSTGFSGGEIRGQIFRIK
jgi:hypothetical protein